MCWTTIRFVSEDTVKMVILSKLLDLAEFYDPPFRFCTEISIEIAIEDKDEILRGRIDALVIQQQLWIIFIKSKRTTFSLAARWRWAITGWHPPTD